MNSNHQGDAMQQDVAIISLIDRAKAIAGSDYKLAQALEVPRQHVSGWRTGKRPCPPEEAALMANIAGASPEQWLIRGVLAKHAGTKKGERLAIALGKASVATGAVIASVGAHASSAYSDVLRCIERLSYRSSCPAR